MRTPRRAGLIGRLGGLLREDLGLEVDEISCCAFSARETRRGDGARREARVDGVNYFSGDGDDTCEFRESRRGARLAFHARGGLADSRRRETARLWRQASRGSAAAIARQRRAVDCFQPLTGLLLCWNLRAALSGALRRLGYYTRRVNSPLSVARVPRRSS